MLREEYKEALTISRKYHGRKKDQSEKLYTYIATAVKEAQDPQHPTSGKAIEFIVKLYEPFIKKVSYTTFCSLKKQYEFQDAFQETVEIFLKLLYKYKPDLASFSYYIYNFLPQYMKIRINHELRIQQTPVDSFIIDALLAAGIDHNGFDQFDFFDVPLLEQEYITFIHNRSLKESKSGTMKEVCNSYFLGHKTCSEIAQDLHISYHAVYEIIGKIKIELIEFLRTSKYYDHTTSDLDMDLVSCNLEK